MIFPAHDRTAAREGFNPRAVLIVENDSAIAEMLSATLRNGGFGARIAESADEAQAQIARTLPDLVLVDSMLAVTSGLALTERWRSTARTRELPVVVLSARTDDVDRVAGLNAGADDYLALPCSPNELLARIRAVLRRKERQALDSAIRVGELQINAVTWRVQRDDLMVKVSVSEFKLLHFLMTHPERVHSRVELLEGVWDAESVATERAVDVKVKRLRKALLTVACDWMIQTVHGVGYRLSQQPEPAAR